METRLICLKMVGILSRPNSDSKEFPKGKVSLVSCFNNFDRVSNFQFIILTCKN